MQLYTHGVCFSIGPNIHGLPLSTATFMAEISSSPPTGLYFALEILVMKSNARPGSNIGSCRVLPCILLFSKQCFLICLGFRVIYSIGRMICKWRKITSSILSIKTWPLNCSSLRVTLSFSVRILEIWPTDPFHGIWLLSISLNYTPVKFLQISYFHLAMISFQSFQ